MAPSKMQGVGGVFLRRFMACTLERQGAKDVWYKQLTKLAPENETTLMVAEASLVLLLPYYLTGEARRAIFATTPMRQ